MTDKSHRPGVRRADRERRRVAQSTDTPPTEKEIAAARDALATKWAPQFGLEPARGPWSRILLSVSYEHVVLRLPAHLPPMLPSALPGDEIVSLWQLNDAEVKDAYGQLPVVYVSQRVALDRATWREMKDAAHVYGLRFAVFDLPLPARSRRRIFHRLGGREGAAPPSRHEGKGFSATRMTVFRARVAQAPCWRHAP